MNKSLNLSIILFFLVKIGFAQTLEVGLKSQPVKFINPKIYVDSVVDDRDFKEYLGTTKVGSKKQNMNLAGGVASAIKKHTDYILPSSLNKTPVTMHIMVLSVKEEPNNGFEKATVTAYTRFTTSTINGSYVEIFQTSSTVSESSSDATKLYEKLIRQAIENCLEQLNSKDIDKLIANASAIQQVKKEESKSRALPDSIETDKLLNIGSSKSEEVKNPEITQVPSPIKRKVDPVEEYFKMNEMGGCSYLAGNKGNGWNSTYYFTDFLFTSGPVSIPITAGFDIIHNLKTEAAKNYQTSEIYYAKIGAEAFYPLNKYFWLNGGVQIPLGTEKLADLDGNNSETTIFGVSLTQSLRVMSNEYLGVSFAVGFFEQITTSKVMPYNVGVRVEFGVKF